MQPDAPCEGERKREIKGQGAPFATNMSRKRSSHTGSHSGHLTTYKNTASVGLPNGIPIYNLLTYRHLYPVEECVVKGQSLPLDAI
jgi:hypothetical protein